MKTIILAAVAAAFVSNAHASEPTFAESCGHIENHTRFNPTELSEYQECWLGFHKPGETAGVLGSIFYARAGDGFVSMPVSELHSAGSAEAAKAIVVERIVDRTITVEVERIVEVERELTQAQQDAIALFNSLTATGLTAEQAATIVSDLDNGVTLELEDGVTQADLDAALTWNGEVVSNLAVVYNLGRWQIQSAIEADARLNTGLLEDLRSDLRYGLIDGVGYYTAVRGEILRAARAAATHVNIDSDGNFVGTAPAAGSHGGSSSNTGHSSVRIGESDVLILGTPTTRVDAGWSASFTANGRTFGIVGGSDDTAPTRLDAAYASFTYIEANNLAEITAVMSVVESAYDAGYADGHADGYAEGYADGFADGVASVQ